MELLTAPLNFDFGIRKNLFGFPDDSPQNPKPKNKTGITKSKKTTPGGAKLGQKTKGTTKPTEQFEFRFEQHITIETVSPIQLGLDFEEETTPEQNQSPTNQEEPTERPEVAEDAFSVLLRTIPKYPQLDEDEEKALVRIAQTESGPDALKAEEVLILSNLRLVISMAKKHTRFGCPIEDLVSEGNIGLKTAISKYQPDKGTRLSTYATWWIKQHLRKATNESTRAMRIPLCQQKTVRDIHATAARLSEITGQEPSDEEIAEELGKKTHIVTTLRNLTSLSLQHAPEDSLKFEEILADQSGNAETPLEKLAKKNTGETLRNLIKARLNNKEQAVIELRFGLAPNSGTGLTLEEIGKRLDLTRERIRQIQEQALKKLKRSLTAQNAQEPTLLSLTLPLTA